MDAHAIGAIITLHEIVRDYGLRLVDDLSDDDMRAQPVHDVTLNHPAWLLSHLNAYPPVLAKILRGEPVEDPLGHKHGRNSKPEADASHYLHRDELVQQFVDVHADAVDALSACPLARFDDAVPIQRFRERFPSIGVLPTQFLIKHLSTHLGQLSAWRRAGGRPAV